jgi:hypothetical protein
MTMMADRQTTSFRSSKNIQDSYTLTRRQIDKPVKPHETSDMQKLNIHKYVP